MALSGLVLLTVSGLVFGLALTHPQRTKGDPFKKDRAAAALALKALSAGDLAALDGHLAAHRGNPDFAYFFALKATARALGDALGSVAASSGRGELKKGVDAHAYEIALTDLAGTLALATHGVGDRALPQSWADNFVDATTAPEELYGEVPDSADTARRARAAQDVANKQNLLLLLSRGYWSVDFLKKVTTGYWEFDRKAGDDAWPGLTSKSAAYAPAPNGVYLTDGVLALTAALTANPAASKWAFTELNAGTKRVDGSDHVIGKFTHFLMFEHEFPETSDGDTLGMTATLTALSSAIDAGGTVEIDEVVSYLNLQPGPLRDALALRAIARDLAAERGCSWDPRDYLKCAKAAALAVWHWVQRWGHVVLDILTLATFAPPPFSLIGIAAAGTNATWYAIDGDFALAGLSLAAAVPGLAYGKIAKGMKVGAAATKAAEEADDVAKAARAINAGSKASRVRELALAGASRIEKSPRSGYKLERQASDDVAERIPGSVTEHRLDPGCRKSCSGRRHVDVFDPKTKKCIEVKKGNLRTNHKHERNEVAKDLLLLKKKQCASVEWHFLPDADGNIGPATALRELLQNRAIPYVVYLP